MKKKTAHSRNSSKLNRKKAYTLGTVPNSTEKKRTLSEQFQTQQKKTAHSRNSSKLNRKKPYTLGTVPNSTEKNRTHSEQFQTQQKKNVERGETIDTPNTQIHDRPLTSLG
jgi:hypothetical protein